MFNKLKKRIENDGAGLSGQLTNSASSGQLCRTVSTESVDSVCSTVGGGTKSSGTRRLEAKVQELAGLVRTRNQQLEKLQRAMDKQKQDYECIIDKQQRTNEHQVHDAVNGFCTELLQSNKEREILATRVTELTRQLEQKDAGREERASLTQNELAELRHVTLLTQTELRDSQTELTHCRSELEQLRVALAQSMAEQKKVAQHNEQLEQLCRSHQDIICALKQDAQQREQSIVEREGDAAAAAALTRVELRARQHELAAEFAATTARAVQEQLRSRVDTLELELAAAQKYAAAKIDEMQRQLEAEQLHVKKLTESASRANADAVATRQQLLACTQEADELRSAQFARELRLTELRSALDRSSQDTELFNRRLMTAEEDASKSRRQFENAAAKWAEERIGWARQLEDAQCASAAADTMRIAMTQEFDAAKASVAELQRRVGELEADRDTVIVQLDTDEVAALRHQLRVCHAQLEERNKTVRVQQVRLQDMKKTLQRELRVQALPGDPDHSHPYSAAPPAMTTSESAPFDRGFQSALEESINVKYLKHVVLKFLLSRESEALHLVRVIATILKYSVDEERLIRQALELRRNSTWFTAKQLKQTERQLSAAAGNGQLSKLIPPF